MNLDLYNPFIEDEGMKQQKVYIKSLDEDKLMFKIKKWLEEQQGDWKPDWRDTYQVKRSLYYSYIDDILTEKSSFNCNYISKLPIFKTDEIAQKFIEVFEREIREVFFKC